MDVKAYCDNIERAIATLGQWAQNPSLMPKIADTFTRPVFVGPIDSSANRQAAFAEACNTNKMRALNLRINFYDINKQLDIGWLEF